MEIVDLKKYGTKCYHPVNFECEKLKQVLATFFK